MLHGVRRRASTEAAEGRSAGGTGAPIVNG